MNRSVGGWVSVCYRGVVISPTSTLMIFITRDGIINCLRTHSHTHTPPTGSSLTCVNFPQGEGLAATGRLWRESLLLGRKLCLHVTTHGWWLKAIYKMKKGFQAQVQATAGRVRFSQVQLMVFDQKVNPGTRIQNRRRFQDTGLIHESQRVRNQDRNSQENVVNLSKKRVTHKVFASVPSSTLRT